MASVIQVGDTFSPLLSEVAEINPRFDRSAVSDESEPISFVPMANVSDQTGSITNEIERPISEVLKGFTPFQQGDVLVAKITPCFENGKIAHAIINRRFGFGSTEFHVVRAHPHALDDRYLYHFLCRDRIRLEGERKMTGSAGQRRVPKYFLENLQIPLPPLEEQRRIAAILNKADALRVKRREAIAKLDQLLQSVFLEMFGDPVANPHGWERMSLGQLISDGPQNGLYKPASDYGSGTPILRIDVFSNGDHIDFELPKRLRVTDDELNKYALNENDVVINRVNSPEHLGKVALITRLKEPAVFESNMMRFALDTTRVESEYVVEALRSRYAKQQIQRCRKDAINQSSINQSDVRSLEVLVPPLDYQKRYKRVSAATRAMKERSLAFLDKVEIISLALQQRAFGGQL